MTETKKKTAVKSAEELAPTKPDAEKDLPTVEEVLNASFEQDPEFEFSIAWSQIQPVYQKVLNNAARHVKQKGFRPGKVPAHLAEEMLDRNYLLQEVLRDLAPTAYQKALSEKNLTCFSDPELLAKKTDRNQDWVLLAVLPQKPEIKLADYKKVLVKQKEIFLKELKENQDKIIAAAKTEEEKKDLQILTEEQMQAQSTDRALLTLLGEIKPKVSQILVKRTAQREFDKLMDQLKQYQITLDDYLKNTGSSIEIVSQQLMLNSLQNIQMEFLLDALLEAEKITANEEEISVKLAEVMPNVTQEDEKKRQLEEPTVHDYLELLTKRKKLADWLISL